MLRYSPSMVQFRCFINVILLKSILTAYFIKSRTLYLFVGKKNSGEWADFWIYVKCREINNVEFLKLNAFDVELVELWTECKN